MKSWLLAILVMVVGSGWAGEALASSEKPHQPASSAAATGNPADSGPTMQETVAYIMDKLKNYSVDHGWMFPASSWTTYASNIAIQFQSDEFDYSLDFQKKKMADQENNHAEGHQSSSVEIADLVNAGVVSEWGSWVVTLTCRDQHECVHKSWSVHSGSICNGNDCNDIGNHSQDQTNLPIFMNNQAEAQRVASAFNHLIQLYQIQNPAKKELF